MSRWNNWRTRAIIIASLVCAALILSLGLTANQAAAGIPSADPPTGKAAIPPLNDGFDALPQGLKGISYSTLSYMGKVHPPTSRTTSRTSSWKNPFAPLLTIIWGPEQSTSGATAAGEPATGMHPTNPLYALVSGNVTVDHTTDGGNTWLSISPPNAAGYGDVVNAWLQSGPANALEVALNPASDGADYTCARSTNFGVTWVSDLGCTNTIRTTFFDDREYLWVDRNPASPFSGRVYLTGAMFDSGSTGSYNSVTLRWSSDAGVSWNPPSANPIPIVASNEYALSQNHNEYPSLGISPNGTLGYAWHRGACCGSPPGINVPNKVMFARSTDGGVTFPFSTTIVTVPLNQTIPFNSTSPLGVRWSDTPNITADPVTNGTFYAIWTQYRTASNANSAAVYLSKTTDNGVTWSVPVIPYNNPNANIFQGFGWVSVTPDHTVHLTYLGGTSSNTVVAQFYVQSTDGGATWTTPFQLSNTTFGAFGTTTDYEANDVGGYNGANGSILAGWAENNHRASIGSFIVGTPTSTATPCSPIPCTSTPTFTPTFTPTPTDTPCGVNSNYVITTGTQAIIPGTTDTGNHTDDGLTTISLPFPVTLYGQTYTSAQVSSNGQMDFTAGDSAFTNVCLPDTVASNAIFPHWDDLHTDQVGSCPNYGPNGCGIFTAVSGPLGSRTFVVEWRAVYYTPNTQLANFEVVFNENQPDRFSIIYGQVDQGGSSATVGVQKDTGSLLTQYECNTASTITTNLMLTFIQNFCGPTNTPTNTPTGTPPTSTPTNTFTITPTNTNTSIPTNTFTPTITPTPTATAALCGPGSNYLITTGTRLIDPGTTDTGNHTDDGTTTIALPFTFSFYGQAFTSANLSSNGDLQFTTNSNSLGNVCLPTTTFSNAIMAHWDDLRTDQVGSCPNYGAAGCGIFTSVVGVAPNRIFNIEWRSVYFGNTAQLANFEIRLYEQGPIDLVYGQVDQGGSSATVGVQRDTGSQFTQFECNTAGTLTNGLLVNFAQVACATPTGTPPTLTPSNTPTLTPTPTATLCGNYTFSTATGTITPGTTDTGNHTDDGLTTISLPFPVALYGISYTSAQVSSNGQMDFGTGDTAFTNSCLPDTAATNAIFPHWDDLRTDTQTGCSAYTSGCGIFTAVSGSPGSRVFVVEWRAVYFAATTSAVNFELVFRENQPGNFSIVYGAVPDVGNSATVGVQFSNGSGGAFTQVECNTGGLSPNEEIDFTSPCGSPATATPTNTPTATRTFTATPTNTPAQMLIGHVTYQGISQTTPTARNIQAITLTLCIGGLPQNFVSTTDGQGFFTVTLSLPTGSYNWQIKSYKSISNAGSLVLGPGTTNQEFGTMRGGDTNNNNVINTADFNTMKNNFNIPNPNSFTDFNNDGVVNTADFNILKGNFNVPPGLMTCP